VIEDSLEFIMAQVSKVATRREPAWVAAGSFLGGAALAMLVTLVIVH
jgi:RsiW-degrading membrane proteinase PrsW (M82 family)